MCSMWAAMSPWPCGPCIWAWTAKAAPRTRAALRQNVMIFLICLSPLGAPLLRGAVVSSSFRIGAPAAPVLRTTQVLCKRCKAVDSQDRSAGEAVPPPVHGEDQLGARRVALQFLTQRGGVDVHRAGGGHGVVPPDLVEQLVSGEQRAPVLDEVGEELELQRREGDRLAAAEDLGAPEVDADVADGVGARGGGGRRACAAEQGFHAGEQLDHLEGLGHIIVGAQ